MFESPLPKFSNDLAMIAKVASHTAESDHTMSCTNQQTALCAGATEPLATETKSWPWGVSKDHRLGVKVASQGFMNLDQGVSQRSMTF